MIEDTTRSGKDSHPTKIIIIAINLFIMIAYTLLFRFLGRYQDLGSILLDAFAVGLQVAICLITAIFINKKEFLLSALIILLVGFSTCWVAFTH